MGTQTSKKQQESVDPVARLMWALSFPGVSHAAGKVLAALASHADQQKLTCWPAVETLARETQVSRRGVQYALRKLETAGAIRTERSSGRSSSLYRLMIAPNPARIAPFNPARIAPFNPARIALVNPARIALVNPARIAPQPRKDCAFQPRKDCAPTELSLEQSKREQGKQQQERAREASGEASDEAPTTPAAAAASPIDSSSSTSKSKTGRHTCPKCANTWPEKYGAICFKCQCDVEHAQLHEEELAKLEEESRLYEEAHRVSETAQEINRALHGKRTLPGSWLYHQDLLPLIADRDFTEVCEVVRGIQSCTTGAREVLRRLQPASTGTQTSAGGIQTSAGRTTLNRGLNEGNEGCVIWDRLRAAVSSMTTFASSYSTL